MFTPSLRITSRIYLHWLIDLHLFTRRLEYFTAIVVMDGLYVFFFIFFFLLHLLPIVFKHSLNLKIKEYLIAPVIA